MAFSFAQISQVLCAIDLFRRRGIIRKPSQLVPSKVGNNWSYPGVVVEWREGNGLAAGWGVALCIGGRGWQCGHLALLLAGGVGRWPTGKRRASPPNGGLLHNQYAFSSGNRPPHANSSGGRKGGGAMHKC